MKTYAFEVIICEGNDEWWESNPSGKDAENEIKSCLFDHGFYEDNTSVELIEEHQLTTLQQHNALLRRAL